LPPWLLLALLVSFSVALLYQLVTRRFGWRLITYWVLILAGLIAAEALAETAGWNISRFGELRVIPDAVGVALVLLVLWFLGI
jgi:hypothetical protein